MKITDIRTKMVTVPFARFGEFEPVSMWYMTRPASIHCITFIDTDEGITGVGTQGDQHTIMNVVRPKLIGKDPFNIETLEKDIGGPHFKQWVVPTDTLAAIDGALWDIVGKACGQPLYKIWGGKANQTIPVRYWMDCRGPEEMAAEALKAKQRGWRALKVKVGTDPSTDIERIKSIREAVGDDMQLCVDLNGGYTINVAINTLRRMKKYEIASIEEPVPNVWPYDSGSLECMADIRKIVGIPIEVHSHGPNCVELIKAVIHYRAADVVHLSPMWTGSILECKRICAVAEAGGLTVTGQSSCAELGPRNALMLHLITSERAFKGTHDNSTHHLEPPSGDIIKKEFQTIGGEIKVPEGPGLGIEIDEEKVEYFHELYKSGKYVIGPGTGRTDPNYWF